jgi:AraC-like DNA-binding protein
MEVHDEVSGDLCAPFRGGMGRDTQNTDTAARVFDDREDVVGPRESTAAPEKSLQAEDHGPGVNDLLWGAPGDRLTSELNEVGLDHTSVLKRIEAELLARLCLTTPDDLSRSDLVHTAIARLSTSTGAQPERVRTTARRLGISERHLRNLFDRAVGMSPKRARVHQSSANRTHSCPYRFVGTARHRSGNVFAPKRGYDYFLDLQ